MEPSFTILEHPSDIGIEARGNTMAEAFQKAAEGLVSLIVDITTVSASDSREILIRAPESSQLLVRWLSEILYFYDGQGFISGKFEISKISGTALTATVRGEPFISKKHKTRLDVKAVTYHQLLVSEDSNGALVRVYFDI